jgi:hypothetical protein
MNLDGSVPAGNPFPQSLVYSFGHRNPQGLTRLPGDGIVVSEHGASSDDEINLIAGRGNYGWPAVRGFCDQASESGYCDTTAVVEPLIAWTPTIAPAGLEFYDSPAIPEWRNSLLLVTLKERDLRVLKLNPGRDSIVGETIFYNDMYGRLRDVCVSPGGEVFLATSNTDGRGTPSSGDDRIIKIVPATSSVVPVNGPALRPAQRITFLVKGSTLTIRERQGTLVMYGVNGKRLRTIPLSAGSPEPGFAAGGYYYRYVPVTGDAVSGVTVIPGL